MIVLCRSCGQVISDAPVLRKMPPIGSPMRIRSRSCRLDCRRSVYPAMETVAKMLKAMLRICPPANCVRQLFRPKTSLSSRSA